MPRSSSCFKVTAVTAAWRKVWVGETGVDVGRPVRELLVLSRLEMGCQAESNGEKWMI